LRDVGCGHGAMRASASRSRETPSPPFRLFYHRDLTLNCQRGCRWTNSPIFRSRRWVARAFRGQSSLQSRALVARARKRTARTEGSDSRSGDLQDRLCPSQILFSVGRVYVESQQCVCARKNKGFFFNLVPLFVGKLDNLADVR
jgi:hypothetical protein